MNFSTFVMGLADIICAILLVVSFGLSLWVYPLVIIMVIKGAMSFI